MTHSKPKLSTKIVLSVALPLAVVAIFFIFPSSASAAITYSGSTITVAGQSASIGDINSALNDPTVLEQVSPKIWLLKKKLQVNTDATLYINDSDTNELRLLSMNDANVVFISVSGSLQVNNTKITSWNTSTSAPAPNTDNPRAFIKVLGASSKARLTNSNIAYLGSPSNTGLELQLGPDEPYFVENCTVTDVKNFIETSTTYGATKPAHIYNNTLTTNNMAGVTTRLNGSIIYGNMLRNGIHPRAAINITVQNNTVLEGGWNGIEFSGTDNSIAMGDVVTGVVHNGMQIGDSIGIVGSHNNTFKNAEVYEPGDNAYYITSSNPAISEELKPINILLEDCIAHDVGARGFVLDDVRNVTIRRFKAWNITGSDADFIRTKRAYLIDSDLEGEISVSSSEDINLINTKFSGFSGSWVENGDVTIYYNLDVLVKDKNGNPVEGATVSVSHPNTSIDWYGDGSEYREIEVKPINLHTEEISTPLIQSNLLSPQQITTTYTGANGHTPLPSDEDNALVIADYRIDRHGSPWYQHPLQTTYFNNNTITAEKDGVINSTTANPDSTWYRSNPNTYKNTITIVLDTSVSTPTFSPITGTYPTTQTVSISTATTDATIRYTTNGTDPTESSTIYTNPITVSSTTTIKARAYKSGSTPSSIATATYTIATPILTTITVSPSTASINVGSTQTFTATPKDQFGNAMTGTTISWTSSNTEVATINSSGVATAVAIGTATITVQNGSTTNTATVTVTAGLVAYWSFNENSGTTVNDSLSNNNTGTINGATWTSGKVNSALSFDGTNDYVNAGSGTSLNITDEITISAWVKPSNDSVRQIIVWKGVAGDGFGPDDIELHVEAVSYGYFGAQYMGQSLLYAPTGGFSTGVWYHLALTVKNGQFARFYQDGILRASNESLVAYDVSSVSPQTYIGRPSSNSRYFSGSIDEVKIYSRALSDSEVLADYNASNNSTDTTLPTISISISSPTNNQTFTNPSITVIGTASDNIALSKVEVKLNSGSYQTATGTTSWSIPLTLISGSNTITAKATDSSNNTKETSITVTYTPPDTTPPTISNISTSNITSTSATITFTTNESTTSYIEYGLTSSYGSQTTPNSTPLSTFNIPLSSLSSGTTYHYKIISQDIAGNITNSTNKTFATLPSTTSDTTPPSAIANLASSNITQTSVNLSWTSPGDDGATGTASNYDIRYSTQTITEANWASATQVTGEPNPSVAGTAQSKYISIGLTPNTTYYFAIKSQDEVPNVSSLSNILQITTLAETVTPPPVSGGGGGGGGGSTGGGGSYSDTTPPAKPADFKLAPADKQITLTWKNPTDSDFVRVVIVRKENSAPASQTDGTVIYEGTNQTYADINLDNTKTYHYAIFAYDAKPNYSQILSLSAQPQAGVDSTSTINTPTPIYPDLTLIKTSTSPKVYVIINGKKKWISTPEVFETLGYKWTEITIADDTAIKSIPNYEDNLIRAINDYKVYLIVNGISRHIPNPEIFLDYGFSWDDVKDVPQATINKYSRGYLIRESRQGKIFYLSPNGVKKWIPNPEIFASYNNKWEDIQVVSKLEMESYPVSNLRRYNNQIFLIEGNTKRLIPNEAVLARYDANLILDVNKKEWDWFGMGNMVK